MTQSLGIAASQLGSGGSGGGGGAADAPHIIGPGVTGDPNPLAGIGVITFVSANNGVYAVKFVWPYKITISKWAGSNLAGGPGFWDVGYYDANMNLMGHIGATAAGGGNAIGGDLIAPITLKAGVYYFGWGASSTSQAVFGWNSNDGSGTAPNILNFNSTKLGTAVNGLSGGALPATLGGINPGPTSGTPFVVFE